MKYRFTLLLTLSLCAVNAFAQAGTNPSPAAPAATTASTTAAAIAITPSTTPIDLARAALVAHGGEKFKTVKSIILRGSVDLYAPNSTQPRPGSFIIVTAGDKHD